MFLIWGAQSSNYIISVAPVGQSAGVLEKCFGNAETIFENVPFWSCVCSTNTHSFSVLKLTDQGSEPDLTLETFSNAATSGINGFLPTSPLSFQAFMLLLFVK